MRKVVILVTTLVVLLMCSSVALAAEREDNLIITPDSSNVFLAYYASIDESSNSIIATTSSNLLYETHQSIDMELQRWNGSYWVKVASWASLKDKSVYSPSSIWGFCFSTIIVPLPASLPIH
jgi:hypothetical protein